MQWVEPTASHALAVAKNLRPEDETEVQLSHGATALQAVQDSWELSDILCAMATDDGVPCGLCGVVGHRIWMLGTPRLTETRRARYQLCMDGRMWVDNCLKEVGGTLFNQVYSKNTESIKWLKYLGFMVEPPKPIGRSGALFCDFWRSN